MRQTIIFCDGGLGNRLNSLIGGLIFSDIIDSKSIIVWPENNWCGCSFNDLFKTEIDVLSKNINEITELNINNIFLIHENQTTFAPNLIYRHSIESINEIQNREESVVYYHNSIPSYFSEDIVLTKLKSLEIKNDLILAAENFINEHNIDNSVHGILFRKTDYQSNPDISLDSNSIYNHINSDTSLKYYICSDDKSTEDEFSKLVNVYVYPKTSYVEKFKPGNWNDFITDNEGRSSNFNVNRPRQSVIEAFVGLLVMSSTNIIVDIPSTFLHYAKHYSNINPLNLETNNIKL
jgi:hypothetical protein